MKKILKPTSIILSNLIILFVIILFFFGAEYSIRIFGPDPSPFQKILSLLEQDPILFWRQRPNLDLNFQNAKVNTSSLGLREKEELGIKKKDSFRIMCLGASATFGWGVSSEKSYPKQLEAILNSSFPNENYSVINCGQIGYSSHQGLAFFKKYILEYKPDLVTVSYLVNDIDRYRFFRSNGLSDKELTASNKLLISIRNIFSRSRLYQFLGSLSKVNRKRGRSNSILKQKLKYAKTRVEKEDYKKNLENIYKLCIKNNIKIIFVRMPFNLKVKSLSAQLHNSFRNMLSEAIMYFDRGNYETSYSKLIKTLELNPYSSRAYYYLGLYYEQKMNYKKAQEVFQKAWDYQIFEIAHDANEHGKIMKELANECDIPVADIETVFEKKKKLELFGNPLDYIHPNEVGHSIVAKELFKKLLN